MAPFLPGDFVTFSGIRRGNEMVVYSIVAQNVQITTLGDLVYIRMELGLLGIDNFNPNTELGESRVISCLLLSKRNLKLANSLFASSLVSHLTTVPLSLFTPWTTTHARVS